ncbi:MAG: hypothetical protein ACRYF0_13475 [Janthinobacterium lividum]
MKNTLKLVAGLALSGLFLTAHAQTTPMKESKMEKKEGKMEAKMNKKEGKMEGKKQKTKMDGEKMKTKM